MKQRIQSSGKTELFSLCVTINAASDRSDWGDPRENLRREGVSGL